MKTDAWYLRNFDGLYSNGDSVVECEQPPKVVTTRYPQFCPSCNDSKGKKHPAGERMIVERAKVDGRFGSCYTCLPCVEKWAGIRGAR